MTLTLIDLYNDITGQAWSMFDGDVEAQDEFEKSVTSSIQKALNELWCSYKFPFRNKTMSFRTRSGVFSYSAPNGNIATEMVKGKREYCVRIGKKYLEYEPDYKTLEEKEGEPEKFYYHNDKLYLYPTPDATYKVDVDYWALFSACNKEEESKATLELEDDYIDIPEKYEHVFKMALLPLAMTVAIANETDENYSGYYKQYEKAYKILIDFCRGLDTEKRMCLR